VANEPVTPFKLKATAEPANNSLPRLRYGRKYRLRARASDLAGNGIPHTATDASAASKEITFGRFEPVPSPNLLFRKSPTTGEAIGMLQQDLPPGLVEAQRLRQEPQVAG